MRWLFLFVLSLNLAYIGLEMSRSSSGDYADVPPLKNVETIVLLSELKQQPDLILVEQVVADVEPADAETPDSEQVAVKPQDEVKKTPEKVASLVEQPIAENVVADVLASAEQEQPTKPSQVVPAQNVSCFTLGPFRDLGKLRGLTREIKSYVVEADFRGREEKEPTLYWVYVKPERNRSQAIKTGKRLKAKKIKDFYMIREGEKINGLSLGHFRNKKGAYGLAEKVKKLGFDVIVEPVFRTYTIYWLDYQLVGGVIIPESIFEKYTRSSKKEKITRLSRDCSS